MTKVKQRKSSDFIRTWVPILISLAALAVSIIFACISEEHYKELTVPHTQFEEINDRLVRLDERIARAENQISNEEDNSSDLLGKMQLVYELRQQAELQWDSGNYSGAGSLISEANDILADIQVTASGSLATGAWVGIGIASIIVLAILIYLILLKTHPPSKRAGEMDTEEPSQK